MNAILKAEKFVIPIGKVDEVTSWFLTRGGAVRWRSLEIGAARPQLLLPANNETGEVYGKPHWAYGEPEAVQPSDIEVEQLEHLAAPKELFKPCEHCTNGKRKLSELAVIRKQTIDELKAAKAADENVNGFSTIPDANWDNDTFRCSYCNGTGLTDYGILKARVARKWYGGYELVSTKKADKVCAMLAKQTGRSVEYDFSCVGYGLAELKFFHRTITAFTVPELASKLFWDAASQASS